MSRLSRSEQTIVITGADAAARVLPRLAVELVALRPWRDEIAVVAEHLVEQHPFSAAPDEHARSRDRAAARLLTEATTNTSPITGHLAA